MRFQEAQIRNFAGVKIMKKILNHPLVIALIGLVILATIAWATAWQDYGAFTGDLADTDDWLIRDISDTPPADGTIKRLPWSGFKTQIGNDADHWVGSAQVYLENGIVVNDADSLYNALDGVDRFLEQADPDPEAGVDEVTAGVQKIFGDNDVAGGSTEWYNPAGDKTNEEYWRCRAAGDELECGPGKELDLFRFNRSGAINPVVDGSYANIGFEAADTTCDDDIAGRVLVTPIVGNLGDTTYTISVCIGGTTNMKDIATFDGANEEWVFDYPITAPSIDASIGHSHWVNTENGGGHKSIDLDTLYPTYCNLTLAVYDSGAGANDNLTINLWDDSVCGGVSGNPKELTVILQDPQALVITIVPDASDIFCIGTNLCGSAGDSTANTTTPANGDKMVLRSIGAYWMEISSFGDWDDPTP